MRTADPLHVQLLRLLRDEGPASRAELGDRLQMPRPRLLAELERLVGLGLVAEAGLAASRGGRRSTLVELNPDLRFAAVDMGASSIDVEVVNGRLEPVAAYAEVADIRSGPKVILHRVNELLHKARVDGAYERLNGVGVGVPGPVSFRDGLPVSPPIMPGWDRYPVRELLSREHGCPAVVDNDVNIMAIGERHGGGALGRRLPLRQDRHRNRVRDLPQRRRLPGHRRLRRGHRAHPGRRRGPTCSCGNAGCLEAVFSGAALAREAGVAARTGSSPALAERLAERGAVSARDVAEAAIEGDVVCIQLIRDGGRRVGQVLAGLVSFTNPSMIVIGGGLAHLGHILLAEIRSVVYRRSLPLATGNLPVVLSELGPRAGVAGAAVLASDVAFGEAS